MPLYQKIVDLANNTTSNSNGNMSRGSIYCPDQLTVPGVSMNKSFFESLVKVTDYF